MLTDQLAALRRLRGIPATILAARSGVDPSAIYAIEHGRRDPRLSTTLLLAHGLGARWLLVDTRGRVSAAETADLIGDNLSNGDREAAAQILLQFVNNLRSSDAFAVAALTIDEPGVREDGWSWAIAGIVELETSRLRIPIPEWATNTKGNPTARWNPWSPDLAEIVDADNVPEPLHRRGVFIELSELSSA